MPKNSLSTYLNKIQSEFSTGLANEHSYRSHLQTLVESYGKNIQAINEPKRVDCGAPDFIVQHNHVPTGHIECKDIDVNLNKTEKTEQLKRYFSALPNLILTDYLEFRYFYDGELVRKTRTAEIDKNGRVKPINDAEDELNQLFDAFFSAEPPNITKPKELADRMARLARQIRFSISKVLEHEAESGSLHNQLKGFKDVLLHDLTDEQFADMYSQTICYGLFSAVCTIPADELQKFSREHAAYHLPKTNPFLRSLFSYIAGPDLDSRIVWIVEDVVLLLKRANIAEILKDFGKATKQEDPVVHFYETFLAQYDPKLREKRGVYYTPEPVVSYIVRSIDHILKTDFNLPDGLADAGKIQKTLKNPQSGKEETKEFHQVQILDPATGTGTFLHGVINHIHDSMAGNEGMWAGYVSEHLLPRLNGFELLMAPYAVAHMKLGLLLQETGYDFREDERLRVFLTNTLEEAEYHSEFLFGQMIAEEANRASDVKRQYPIMVILGNPPYSNFGMMNKNDWILNLLDEYKKGLNEKKINLNDDYIKFIRFAEWKINNIGYGILSFISNHSFIDGITHRRMREVLASTFDKIYIYDLHGNSLKEEKPPNGVVDKNVFDIRQGVSINIFVKNGNNDSCEVYHQELWGERQYKYEILRMKDISTTKWEKINNLYKESCLGKMFFFSKIGYDNIEEYCNSISIDNIFIVNKNGIKTDRDPLFYDYDKEILEKRISNFYFKCDQSFIDQYVIKNSSSYNILEKKEKSSFKKKNISKCLYRPFDIIWLYYSKSITSRPAWSVMKHILNKNNLVLITTRQTKDKWDAYVTKNICGHKSCAAYDINTVFPLYLYPDPDSDSLFDLDEGNERTPNFTPEFLTQLSTYIKLKFIEEGKGDLKKTVGPEDVFHYMYAVFHSPTYRSRYAEFLRIDFPRLPLTSNIKLFCELCALGEELVGLHLLERVPKAFTTYPVKGDNIIEKVRYQEPNNGEPGKVYINATQYFLDVPSEVWEFHIGGYQVCEKWLKDRKGRELTYDDIKHYTNITVALSETIRLMHQIDKTIPGWPLQ